MDIGQIREEVVKHKVKFVHLQFSDLLGVLKAVTIPINQLGDTIKYGKWFDGSSIDGFARISESDMFLKPDLDTFAIIPWTKGNGSTEARLICDVFTPDGKPFAGDPRQILKKQIARAKKLGYDYYVAPELEFFLMKRREDGTIETLPHDHAGYFDQTIDGATAVRHAMGTALSGFGMEVEALHHEVANGQHEINFKYGDALRAADNTITFKYALKMVAKKMDLHATFMAKPFYGINGSGMHTNQSLFKGNENAFYAEDKKYHLSDIALQFIAGQLGHIKGMNAIINPTVNSYKRLVVGYEAPVYISWGQTNRSALMRIPRVNPDKPQTTRCELRCPDPTCNPYLAYAVMLSAGLDGIENKLTAPEPIEESTYEMTPEEITNRGIDTVSRDLYGALLAMKEDKMLSQVLGEETARRYYEIKMSEWDDFRLKVTEWERERYLEIY
jgi:glutamine synthetase